MSNLRVVHLNYSDSDTSGGFARSAYQLHLGLCELGIDSSGLVLKKQGSDSRIAQFVPRRGLLARMNRRLIRNREEHLLDAYQDTRPSGLDLFSSDRAPDGNNLLKQIPDCDVINLHWIKGLVDYASFFGPNMPTQPIVWRFSDMNAFTGGCHYDGGCGKFRECCGRCPQLESHLERDLSRKIWLRKKRVFDRVLDSSLHIVSQSNWLAEEVRSSSILGRFPVTVIPNGVDTSIFRPLEKSSCRRVLGLPDDAHVILFVAGSVENERKGFRYLADAVQSISERSDVNRTWCLAVGRGQLPNDLGIQGMHIGPVTNDRFLAVAYNAADVYVITSLQDNLPNTVLEAMACGVPVVGFDTGGVPDMVRNGETGVLVPVRDSEALADAVIELLANDFFRRQLAVNCRPLIEKEFSRRVCASRFLALYEEILGLKPA